MNRIQPIDPAAATGKTKQLFDAVQKKMGVVPNLTRVLAQAPAALEGYLTLAGALAGGTLSARLREQISLVVAQANGCDYCLSAHTFISGKLGLSESEIVAARQAEGRDGKDDAVLKLAAAIVAQRGEVGDAVLENARAAGVTDGEIVEVTANVALSVLTNYVNNVAHTVVDFPKVTAANIPVEAGDSACGCQH